MHVEGCAGGGSSSLGCDGRNRPICKGCTFVVLPKKLPISTIVFAAVKNSQGGHSQSVESAARSPKMASTPRRSSERGVELALVALLKLVKYAVKAWSLS